MQQITRSNRVTLTKIKHLRIAMEKKKIQLGVNPSTASAKLVKDILFNLIKDEPCFRNCGKPLTRDTFSIEHKIAWLDSNNPIELFFNLDNIAFSHLSCNISAATRKKVHINQIAKKKHDWKKYYDKHSENILSKKRLRYHSKNIPA